jgi:uncharacterized membrane protein YbhN (UPF0104 family)
MGVLKKAIRFIGPVLLLVIFIKFVDIQLLLRTLGNASGFYLFLSYFVTILLYGAKMVRIHLPLKKSDVIIPPFYFTKIYVSSRLAGWISNALLSDIMNAGILMAEQEKKMRITSVFILNRIADTVATSLLFGIVLFMNIGLMKGLIDVNYRKAIFMVIGMFAVLLVICAFWNSLKAYVQDILTAGREFSVETGLLTVLTVVCSIFSVYWNAKALHIEIPTGFLLLCYTIGIGITMLPISFSGIGTREMAFVFLMNLVSIPSEQAIAVSFMEFIVIPLLSLCTLYMISLVGVRYENRDHG